MLGVALLILSAVLAFQLYAEVLGNHRQEEEEEPLYLTISDIDEIADEQIELIRSIDANGYRLRRDSTDHQIELFRLLAHAYDRYYETEADIDLLNYAELIAQNFVADFFTLSNKQSRTDIGGLQFISEEMVDDFRSFALDTFYLYLNQHIESYGHTSLPMVETTTVLSSSFDSHWLEIETDDHLEGEENESDETMRWPWPSEPVPEMEEIRTIIIEIEWAFARSRLSQLNQFQTSARFTLIEGEDGVRIHVIELIEDEWDEDWNFYLGDSHN